jgi:hypothetical protein
MPNQQLTQLTLILSTITTTLALATPASAHRLPLYTRLVDGSTLAPGLEPNFRIYDPSIRCRTVTFTLEGRQKLSNGQTQSVGTLYRYSQDSSLQKLYEINHYGSQGIQNVQPSCTGANIVFSGSGPTTHSIIDSYLSIPKLSPGLQSGQRVTGTNEIVDLYSFRGMLAPATISGNQIAASNLVQTYLLTAASNPAAPSTIRQLPPGNGAYPDLSVEDIVTTVPLERDFQGNPFRGGAIVIYKTDSDRPPFTVVDRNTPVHDGQGTFTSFGYELSPITIPNVKVLATPKISSIRSVATSSNIVFLGKGINQQEGIYIAFNSYDPNGPNLKTVARAGQQAPGTLTTFKSLTKDSDNTFNQFDISLGGSVAFVAKLTPTEPEDENPMGLFYWIGGGQQKVIATGDTLQGKRVKSFSVGSRMIEARSIVFTVIFADNTTALYRADMP